MVEERLRAGFARAEGDVIALFSFLVGAYGEDTARVFSGASNRKAKGNAHRSQQMKSLVRKKEEIAHTESSQTLAQVPRDVVAYPEVIHISSRQSPKQSSVVLACSEQGMYLVAFKSPFQWSQSDYFLVVRACGQLWKGVLEKSQSRLS